MNLLKTKKCCTSTGEHWWDEDGKCRICETMKPNPLKQVIDNVKIEGMLHILPEDRDKFVDAVRLWLKGVAEGMKKGRKICFGTDCTSEKIKGYNKALDDLIERIER